MASMRRIGFAALEVSLELRVELAEVVPQPDKTRNLRRPERRCKLRGKLGHSAEVGYEIVTNADLVH
jgi:hypothetical protein